MRINSPATILSGQGDGKKSLNRCYQRADKSTRSLLTQLHSRTLLARLVNWPNRPENTGSRIRPGPELGLTAYRQKTKLSITFSVQHLTGLVAAHADISPGNANCEKECVGQSALSIQSSRLLLISMGMKERDKQNEPSRLLKLVSSPRCQHNCLRKKIPKQSNAKSIVE